MPCKTANNIIPETTFPVNLIPPHTAIAVKE
jgi:hypothetical protein